MRYTICVHFTWDPAKAAGNLAKHGMAFEAADGFQFETALVRATLRHGDGEPRLEAYGLIGDRLHVMVYSVETAATRVISLRKANDREMGRYEDET